MKKERKERIKYENIIAILFFLFFTTPILSPSIAGFTIYIHWIIPLLDFKFIKEILSIRLKFIYICIITIMLILFIFLGKLITVIKILLLVETLLYMFYCKKNRTIKYLYWGINFNIIVAIFQFILAYINPNLAYLIGPTNISKLIWGEYATQTFTNFYPIFKLIRVSGWSREAGFFASLIIISFISYIEDKEQNKNIVQILLFIIGYIISFSKASLILIPILIVIGLKNYLKKIPYYVSIMIVIIGLILGAEYLQYKGIYTKNNESIIHRISGYAILEDLEPKELIMGVKKIEDINEKALQKNEFLSYIYNYKEFCGIPNIIINHGLIITIIFIISLRKLGFETPQFLILSMMTITVDYFTATSFVILTYYLCFNINNKFKDFFKAKNEKELINENINS